MRSVVRFELLFLVLFAPGLADATTIIPFSDESLVDKAPLIIRGTVAGRMPNLTERAVTDWLISVDRTLKGSLGTGALVVRILGGDLSGGVRLMIHGAPQFRQGETVLLFLSEGPDPDTYSVYQFMQGAFHRLSGRNRPVAWQDLSDVRVLPKSVGHVSQSPTLRDFDSFERWVEDRANGVERAPDYRFQPSAGELQSISDEFTLQTSGALNIRWFDFDGGSSVAWHMNGSQSGLSGGGLTEFKRAMAAWNGESTTPVRYVYGGSSSSSAEFSGPDGQNVILFGDPNNTIGDFDCANDSGALAVSGNWGDPAIGSFNGKSFVRIVEAEVVVNDGLECQFPHLANGSKYFERMFGTMLGYTLGIGASSWDLNEPNDTLRNALMYPYHSRADTRGAQLNSDDVKALQALYKKVKTTTTKPPASGCPAGTAPDTLCLMKGRFHVTGTWQNQFDGSSGVAKPIPNSDLSGFFYFTDPRNVELIMKILDFGTEFKVFYSQLTNLKFTLTVRDTATGRTKSYSNTPGDCGAIDQNFAFGLTSGAQSLVDSTTSPVTGTCSPSTGTLCTLDRRFAITVDWRNQFNGASGTGLAKTLSNLTGAFAFDDPRNLELLIKTLEFPDKILVLWGSLSNFEYRINIFDTLTGRSKSYANPAGKYCGGLDENAF